MTASSPVTSALDVEFASAMHGLAPHTAFTLESIAGADGLHALRAVDADIRLFLLDASVVASDYAPHVPSGARAEVGARDEDTLRVLVVANPSEEGVHVNLRAPIILHPKTGRATQVILEEQTYPIRALLGGG